MRSRLTSEYLIPSVPLLIPSLMPIVLKIKPTMSLSHTPCFTIFARSFRCMLHVLPSYPILHTPICGFFRSSSVNPIPYNIACAAGCVGSCVIVFEYLFSSFISMYMLSPLALLSSFVASHSCTFRNSIQQLNITTQLLFVSLFHSVYALQKN